MKVEIITNYITITDDMDTMTKMNATFANDAVKGLSEQLKNSDMYKLATSNNMPVEGTYELTLTADVNKLVVFSKRQISFDGEVIAKYSN